MPMANMIGNLKVLYLSILIMVVSGSGPLKADSPAAPNPGKVLRAHGVALTEHAVVGALRNRDIEVRRAAADFLTQRWPGAAVSAMEQAVLKEPDRFTRIWMAEDLFRLGDAQGRKILVSECHDSNEHGNVRMFAATILSREFQDDSCLAPVLDVLQADGDPNDDGAKEQALELAPILIGRVDQNQSQRIFELLTKSLRDPVPYLRITASITLERLGDVRAIPMLEAAIAKETDDGCLHVMKSSLKVLQSKTQIH